MHFGPLSDNDNIFADWNRKGSWAGKLRHVCASWTLSQCCTKEEFGNALLSDAVIRFVSPYQHIFTLQPVQETVCDFKLMWLFDNFFQNSGKNNTALLFQLQKSVRIFFLERLWRHKEKKFLLWSIKSLSRSCGKSRTFPNRTTAHLWLRPLKVRMC